jgi:hypothetical protein
MVEKLDLPFPLLSDPDGEGAVKPYGVWSEGRRIARPAIVVITPDGAEAVRRESSDFADRPPEEEVLEAVRRLRLPPTTQPRPAPGRPEPGPRALSLAFLGPYYRGARFAAEALALRVPEVKEQADRLIEVVERYGEAIRELRRSLDGGAA